MNTRFDVFIDSDAFVGRFYPDDYHYSRCQETFSSFEREQKTLVTSSLVVIEVATVLSHRSGQDQARLFLDYIKKSELPIIHIDEVLQSEALHLFRLQQKKGSSVTDCSNVVIIRRFDIPVLFSFDSVYTKVFNIPSVN